MQNAIKTETLPELIADVDRSGFTVLLGGDSRRVDGDRLLVAAGRSVVASLAHLTNNVGDFGIVLIDQALLPDQSIFDFACEPEPLLTRPWAEVAERADGLLARPLRGQHGLDQDVIGVSPAFVGPARFADVHNSTANQFVPL